MKDPKHLQAPLSDSIRNQIRTVWQDPLTRARYAAFPTCRRKVSKVIDAGENGLNEIGCSFWILHRNVRSFVIEVLQRGTQPLNAH